MIISDPGGRLHKEKVALIKEQMPYMDEGILLLEVTVLVVVPAVAVVHLT